MSRRDRGQDHRSAQDEETDVSRQPLDVVRDAEQRIAERLAEATASRDTVRAAQEQAEGLLAEARRTARADAEAVTARVTAATERELAGIRTAGQEQARRLREVAAARLDRDTDALVAVVLGVGGPGHPDRAGRA